MNKKFSTLLTAGLLIAGSLFSMANATTQNLSLRIGDRAATAPFVNKKYFVVQQTGSGTPQTSDFVLGFEKGTSDAEIKAATAMTLTVGDNKGTPTYTINNAAEDATEANYLWTVTEAEDHLSYTFVNAATGKQLLLDGTSKSLFTDYSNTDNTIGNLTFTASGSYAAAAYEGGQLLAVKGSTAGHGLKLAAAAITWETSDAGAFYLYEVKSDIIPATDLNDLGNGSFSLTYKDATVNPFSGEIKAFEVKSISGVENGTYFATSWGGLDAITDISDFKKCTFIAVDPLNRWNINALEANTEGRKLITVSGKNLLTTTTKEQIKSGKVASKNAAFQVSENEVYSKNSYSLSVASATVMNAEGKATDDISNLLIAAVPSLKELIVTTVVAGSKGADKFVSTCTLANSNLVSVDKILSAKAASVFNIQFMSKQNVETGVTDEKEYTTKSEYNKFLGINADGMFAQGSDFVNLEAPENQWIIVGADKEAKTFTFQNRELTDKTFTVKLIATGKTANTYKIVEGTSAEFSYAYVDKEDGEYKIADKASNDIYLNGTIIKLIAAEVNPMAGYVTNELDNAGLVRFVFTSEQKTIADELYVAAGADITEDLEVSKDAADALKWSVVKFDASADALDALVSDTIYAYNDYAYYDAAKREVKVETAGDTIAVVAYGFKLYGKDKTYLGVASYKLQPSANNIEDAADAQRFLIKINKNGSYSLIEVPTAEIDYREIIEAATKAFTVDGTAKVDNNTSGTSIYYDYAGITYNFSIAKDEPTPSLAHKPAYVTLNADNKGYVAMDSVTFEGIVAPVSLLKSAYTSDELTFRLDTADSEAYVPSFYISHIGKFMYNAKDSAEYYNDGTASAEGNKMYKLVDDNAKAIFRTAALVSPDTLTTTVNGKEAKVAVEANKGVLAGLNNFKYQIVQATADSEGEYVVKSVNDGYYLYNLNGFLGFTADAAKALVVNVEQSQSPVANEAVTTSSIKVIAGNGVVTVIGAQGKKVAVSNVLGQTVANAVLSSDKAEISTPSGVVIVAVEGETAVKAIVK